MKMTSHKIVKTWIGIYEELNKAYPQDKFTWNFKDLHQIVTELTIAVINNETDKPKST